MPHPLVYAGAALLGLYVLAKPGGALALPTILGSTTDPTQLVAAYANKPIASVTSDARQALVMHMTRVIQARNYTTAFLVPAYPAPRSTSTVDAEKLAASGQVIVTDASGELDRAIAFWGGRWLAPDPTFVARKVQLAHHGGETLLQKAAPALGTVLGGTAGSLLGPAGTAGGAAAGGGLGRILG